MLVALPGWIAIVIVKMTVGLVGGKILGIRTESCRLE